MLSYANHVLTPAPYVTDMRVVLTFSPYSNTNIFQTVDLFLKSV